MKNINKYNQFLNEKLFQKSFDDRISKVDEILFNLAKTKSILSTSLDLFKNFDKRNIDVIMVNRGLDSYISNLLKCLKIMYNILYKTGKNFNDDEILIFINKLDIITNYLSAFTHKARSDTNTLTGIGFNIMSILKYINKIIFIMKVLKKDYKVNFIYDFEDEYILIPKGNFHGIMKRSEYEKKMRKIREKTKDIDPLGEEEWT